MAVIEKLLNAFLLGVPFFLWGSNMVVMEEVMPKTGAMFMAATRLIPAGALILAVAIIRGRKFPSGKQAWLSIALFSFINGALFQGCLVEGLMRTTAGLGSVIIDSQPLTVAVLAAVFYGEVLGPKSIVALAFGIFGLLLIEIPVEKLQSLLSNESPGDKDAPPPNSTETWSIWDSGEWWMLLAAQSMAVGTLMMRWVSKFSDPLMVIGWEVLDISRFNDSRTIALGLTLVIKQVAACCRAASSAMHMVLGGVPVLALSFWKQDLAVSGHLGDLRLEDWAGLIYTSVFGSAVATGLFFYNATRGSLTELSALTLLTPVFATLFGYLLRNETFTVLGLMGSLITLVSIFFVKLEKPKDTEVEDLTKTKYEAVPLDAIP